VLRRANKPVFSDVQCRRFLCALHARGENGKCSEVLVICWEKAKARYPTGSQHSNRRRNCPNKQRGSDNFVEGESYSGEKIKQSILYI